jgi:hypothetical protein
MILDQFWFMMPVLHWNLIENNSSGFDSSKKLIYIMIPQINPNLDTVLTNQGQCFGGLCHKPIN